MHAQSTINVQPVRRGPRGRPRGINDRPVQILMPAAQVDELKEYAEARDATLSSALRRGARAILAGKVEL